MRFLALVTVPNVRNVSVLVVLNGEMSVDSLDILVSVILQILKQAVWEGRFGEKFGRDKVRKREIAFRQKRVDADGDSRERNVMNVVFAGVECFIFT